MSDENILIIILICVGFAYIITKLNKLIDIASLTVSMMLGKMVAEKLDDDTFSIYTDDEGEE